MAIGITDHTGPYTANGSQAAFPFDFTAMSDAEVGVSVNGTLISSALYSVARTDTGGTVNFTAAPVAGGSIMILSQPDFSQLSEFENQGAYNLSTINAINRRSAVKDAYLSSTSKRALLAPVGTEDPLAYFQSIGFKGDRGEAATIAVASTTTLVAGSPATVVNVGTGNDAELQFGIPKGDTGDVTPAAQAAADLASAGAATATTQAGVATTQAGIATSQAVIATTQAAAATTAATSPSFKLQTNSATPTVPPSGVASGDSYWAIDIGTQNLVLYTNSSGTGVISNPAIKQSLSSINTVSGLVQYGTTTFNVLYGIADTNLRPGMLLLADGTMFANLEPGSAANVLLKGGFQTVSGLNQLSAENVGGSYANGLAFLSARIDTNNRVLSGYLADGTMFIGKYDTRLLGAVTASEGPALSRNGPFYSTSGGQIIAYYGSATKVLTTEGVNSEPRPLGDRVAFLSTRLRGVAAPYIMNFDGSNQRAMIDQAMYEGYPMAGQSQTPGYISVPSLTVTPPYPGKAFSYAGGAGPIAEYPAVFGGAGTLTDLMEDPTTPFKGESAASSIGAAILDHELAYRPKLKVVLYGNGYPATAYTGIMKGTGPYNDVIAQTTRLKALGDIEVAAGRAPAGVTRGAISRALILIHGETDFANAIYATNLAQLQSDYETDIRAATLQVEPVPMIISQLGSMRMWATAPDAAGANKSCLAQLAASVANPKIFLACPTYQLTYVGDNIHYTNTSKRLLGEYFEKAIRKVVFEGRDWVPVSPKPFNTWTVGSNTILIPMNVPIGPLAFDTTLVSDPGNKGFNYTDASGRTITNVQITGANSDQILITLSGAIGSTAVLDYAYSNGTNSTSGPATGARGCLRDSDPALSRWDGTTHLYNWAVIFRQAIN